MPTFVTPTHETIKTTDEAVNLDLVRSISRENLDQRTNPPNYNIRFCTSDDEAIRWTYADKDTRDAEYKRILAYANKYPIMRSVYDGSGKRCTVSSF